MKSSINTTRTGARVPFEDTVQKIGIGADWRTPGIHSRKPHKPLPDRVTKCIRVLVVDDHAVVREGLRALLDAAGDMQVIGEAENGMQAVQETRRLQPDVVLLDLAMPLLNGVEAARQITQESPEAAVLILSSYNDPQHLRQAVAAGAAGYLMKESAAADLLEAVRETRKGGSFFSPALLQLLLKGLRGGANEPGSAARANILTWRQAEVLQLVAEGYATKQIARLLILSNKTVEKHRQTLMKKLGLHNIANLTSYAVANGIVDLADIPEQTPAWPVGGAPWTTENIAPGEVTATGCHRTNRVGQN